MKFTYVCKDVSLSEAMKNYCEEKLAKFTRFFKGEEVNVTVTISVLPDGKVCEVAMNSRGVDFRAKAKNDDFYAALDIIIEKLEGQLRKVKTQIEKSHKKSFFDSLDLDNVEDSDEELEIIKRKTLSLAPMDQDEALARMDALGHSFFIYLDSSTGLVNVLYERDDGGFGVIEVEK